MTFFINLKYKTCILLLMVLAFGPGCRKELDNSIAPLLVGKWKWVSTEVHHFVYPLGETKPYFLTPATQGKNFSVEINKSGMFSFYENATVLTKRHLRLKYMYEGYDGKILIEFQTSKKGKTFFSFNLRGLEHDTMYCYDFPYDDSGNYSGFIAGNYLVKEK